jgi:hypothetical protein
MLTVICNSKKLPLLIESPSAFCSTDQPAYEQLVADLYGAIGEIAPPTFASTMCRVEGVPSSGQHALLLQAYSSPLDKEDQSEEDDNDSSSSVILELNSDTVTHLVAFAGDIQSMADQYGRRNLQAVGTEIPVASIPRKLKEFSNNRSQQTPVLPQLWGQYGEARLARPLLPSDVYRIYLDKDDADAVANAARILAFSPVRAQLPAEQADATLPLVFLNPK